MAIHCIRGARWVVAWDPIQKQHFFRQNIDVVFAGDRANEGLALDRLSAAFRNAAIP